VPDWTDIGEVDASSASQIIGVVMESIEELLSSEEAEFVRHVFCFPGGKYPGGAEFWDRISMDCGIWLKPESLGLVRSIGSYKWEPTDKLKLCRVSE
jgi:hypothetical protein